MEASRVSRTVVFPCGCLCDYALRGTYAEQKDWHVVSCNKCAEKRQPGVLEQRAQEAWDKAQPVATVVEG